MRLPPDPFAELTRVQRALRARRGVAAAVTAMGHQLNEVAKRPERAEDGEVSVCVRCGRCRRVLDELWVARDGTIRSVAHGRAHAQRRAAAQVPAGASQSERVRTQALAERWRYRCHRRCGAEHVVSWPRLVAAAGRAVGRVRRADRVILLPADLRG